MTLSGHQETLVRYQPRSFVVCRCLRHSTIPDDPFVIYASSHAEAVKVFGAQYFGTRSHPKPEVIDVRVKISGHPWHRLKVSSLGEVFDVNGELLPFTVRPSAVDRLADLAEAEANSPEELASDLTQFDGHAYLVRMLDRIEKLSNDANATALAPLVAQALECIRELRPRGGSDQ